MFIFSAEEMRQLVDEAIHQVEKIDKEIERRNVLFQLVNESSEIKRKSHHSNANTDQ